MKLAANLIHGPGDKVSAFAARAEELGVHSLWRGEAYAGDAVTAIAWAAAQTSRIVFGSAVMQMAARTPAMTAMTALSLHELTGGRFICGIGMSGPQVVEGWHGVAYTPPLRTTREYAAIMRAIFRAESAVSFDGDVFQLPYRGDGATGLGKALRPRTAAAPELPIYVAAIGPKNVALATEVADGLLPILWNPYRVAQGFGDALAGARRPEFEIAATVPVAVGPDVASCRDKVRPWIAAFVGGMGARSRNFYNALVRRYGFGEAAESVQEAFLSGRRAEAASLVPDELVDELALVGDRARIAASLDAWRESGVDTIIIASPTDASMRLMAELLA
jgi:F420-dependent oxidoreductase-like protein